MTEPIKDLAAQVRRGLDARGWALLERPISGADYEAIARLLGEIDLRTDIKVDPVLEAGLRRERLPSAAARPNTYQASALEFHTDRPRVDVLGWYCVEQDDSGGSSLLIDTEDLPRRFTEEELGELGRVGVTYYLRDAQNRETRHVEPLVSPRGGGWKVFYVPWEVVTPAEGPSREALERFLEYVRDKSERDCLRIRMEEGQCLFIDNWRMLHGRGELPPGSRRHLVRFYIRSHPGGESHR